MEFTLKVTLGNEAMQTAGDLATVLSRAADSVITYYEGEDVIAQESYAPQPLRDINGNKVGEWEVK